MTAKERFESPAWTTRDGRKVPVIEMEDRHLLNAYRLLRREGFISPSTLSFYLSCPEPNGDGAMMAFEAELNAVLNAPVSLFVDLFEMEIRRRGLRPTETVVLPEVCS